MRKKKFINTLFILVTAILVWNHLPYYYSNDKTADYITKNVAHKSRCMCAGYVIQAMWHGGCPIGLVPAYAYSEILPQMGFEEIVVKEYKPARGDISVVPSNSNHPFGHIVVYNGKQWVSDFEQGGELLPSKAYQANGKYQIFRATDGWHWKHVWTSPKDWYEWIEAVWKGWRKIKL
jgi:hypothetical protein